MSRIERITLLRLACGASLLVVAGMPALSAWGACGDYVVIGSGHSMGDAEDRADEPRPAAQDPAGVVPPGIDSGLDGQSAPAPGVPKCRGLNCSRSTNLPLPVPVKYTPGPRSPLVAFQFVEGATGEEGRFCLEAPRDRHPLWTAGRIFRPPRQTLAARIG
jgi:hypothetical protein